MTNAHSSERIARGGSLGNPRVRRWRDADALRPASDHRVSSDDSSEAIVFWDEV